MGQALARWNARLQVTLIIARDQGVVRMDLV
jgi:hypothetical protein